MFATIFKAAGLCLACSIFLLASPLSALELGQKVRVAVGQCLQNLDPRNPCGISPFQSLAHGVGGVFTEPDSLAIQADLPYEDRTDYSIGQLILENDIDKNAIELGWVVSPYTYHDSLPHLFITLTKQPSGSTDRQACFLVPKDKPNPGGTLYPPCPLDGKVWQPMGRFQPGDHVLGQPMVYHVSYYGGNKAWWIQYGGEWIVMEGNTSIARDADAQLLEPTDPNAKGWNAGIESKNSFRYGGPGLGCSIAR